MFYLFDDFIKMYYIVPLFSLVIGTMGYLVNHLNAIDLEFKLMTNFEKMKVFFSTIFIPSIFLTVLIVVSHSMNKDSFKELKKISEVYPDSLILFILIVFLISFIIFIVILLFVWLLSKVFKIKKNVYIYLDDNQGKWLLVRKKSKKELLLKKGRNKYRIISDWKNKTFSEESQTLTWWGETIYKDEKRFKLTKTILSIILIISIVVMVCCNPDPKRILIGSILFLGSIVSFLFYYDSYKNK